MAGVVMIAGQVLTVQGGTGMGVVLAQQVAQAECKE